MWYLIFEVLAYLFCTVFAYHLAKTYGSKCDAALIRIKRDEQNIHRHNFGDLLAFRQYRLAAILFEVASYIGLWLALSNLGDLIS